MSYINADVITHRALREFRENAARQFMAGMNKATELAKANDDTHWVVLHNALNRAEESNVAHAALGVGGKNPDCGFDADMIAALRAHIGDRAERAAERFEAWVDSKAAAYEHEMMYGND